MANKNLVTDKARGSMLWEGIIAERPAMKRHSMGVIESSMKEETKGE